jgi:hypothetical protein
MSLSDIVAVAAPVVGAYFGGPAGAAAGSAVSGYLGTQSTNEANAERADAANAWSAAQYASRYQTMTKDMMAAGLNPMLAYSQSAGTAPTAQQVTFQNPVASASQAYQQVSQGTQSISSASQADAQVKLIDATVDKTREEIKNIPEEGRRLRAVYINLAESSAFLAQQGQTEVVKRQVLDATAKKMVADGLIARAEYDAMVRTNFFGVTAREVKVLSDVSSEWVDKLLPWKQGKSTSEEHTDIVRDRSGREVGRSTYRNKR